MRADNCRLKINRPLLRHEKIKKGQARKLFEDSCVTAYVMEVSVDNIVYLKSEFYGGVSGFKNKIYDCSPDYMILNYPLVVREGVLK